MRKSTIRHWVHGILDLLPLFVIPIFALFSINNDVSEDTVSVTEEPVYYDTNEVTSTSDLVQGNTYRFNDNFTLQESVYIEYISFYNDNVFKLSSGKNTDPSREYLTLYQNSSNLYVYTGLEYWNVGGQSFDFTLYNVVNTEKTETYMISHISESSIVYFKGYREVTTTYPNDVGTSYFNTLYNTVDKYFNMGNVFNMNDLYDWFVTNIFNGNAPASMFIVWNVVLYEFVMDLLMLLYALFMWFIDMCKRLIEKPLNSIK